MVRSGMAWAFVRYSHDYVREEAEARSERLGVHAHGCEPAWEWRQDQRGRYTHTSDPAKSTQGNLCGTSWADDDDVA
jgi:endonuclease YncB( thermonuclease family)